MQYRPAKRPRGISSWFILTLLGFLILSSIPFFLTQASSVSILHNYTEGIAGSTASLAVLNGHPIVSYYDAQHGDLRLAICSNPACSPGTTYTTAIDTEGDVGSRSVVTVV